MSVSEVEYRPHAAVHNWMATLAIIFLSLSGVILSLICIYALPDHTVRPVVGSLFFVTSSAVIISFLFFYWRKDIEIIKASFISDKSEPPKMRISESLSDKIIKWVVLIFVFSFAFYGLILALICIYALPDQTIQPDVGAIYFFFGALPLVSFVFVVWKNWTSERMTR
jgi:drug/metabolite transporter (DMT)-like permease